MDWEVDTKVAPAPIGMRTPRATTSKQKVQMTYAMAPSKKGFFWIFWFQGHRFQNLWNWKLKASWKPPEYGTMTWKKFLEQRKTGNWKHFA